MMISSSISIFQHLHRQYILVLLGFSCGGDVPFEAKMSMSGGTITFLFCRQGKITEIIVSGYVVGDYVGYSELQVASRVLWRAPVPLSRGVL